MDRVSLVVFTLNIPEEIKQNELYRFVEEVGIQELSCRMGEKGKRIKSESFKNISYFLYGGDLQECKKIIADLEIKHPLGEVFYMDIFDEDGNLVDRKTLDLKKKRKISSEEIQDICIYFLEKTWWPNIANRYPFLNFLFF